MHLLPLLSVRGLRRRFGGTAALDGPSFDVHEGEVFGLLGPNGAGKSTLLNVLAGRLASDGGEVTFNGRPHRPDDPQLAGWLGMVSHEDSLNEHLSARETLLLGGSDKWADELLTRFRLTQHADLRAGGLSASLRRRLEVARALLHRPRLLLLDEPTRRVDEESYATIWNTLREWRLTRGLTVLLSTHRVDEAGQCDRLAILDAGRLVACDTPHGLAASINGDVLMLESERPEDVVRLLREKFGLEGRVYKDRVYAETTLGHALLTRVVEGLPHGLLNSISLRRPTLGDVFLKLTGHALGADTSRKTPPPHR